MDINATKLLVLEELARVTAAYDSAVAYTGPGFVQGTREHYGQAVPLLLDHNRSLHRVATALECPGLEAFKR